MIIFYGLQIPSNKRNDNYTQGLAVNTAIVGTKHAVGETKGRLIVLEGGGRGPGPSFDEPYYGPLIPGQKQTITLKVPGEKTAVTVDVIWVASDSEITVDAVLSKYKYDYETIEVYSIDEVEIYD